VRQRLALVEAEAGGWLVTVDERRDRLDTGIDGADQVKLFGQNFPRGKLRTDPHQLVVSGQIILQPSQVQLTATLDESRFQNLVLRGDRAAFKNMGEAVREGIIRPDILGERFGLAIGGGDHLAQCPFLKKANLAELLVTHLFIGHALEFFWPRLVDDMGDFLFCQLATELVFLTFHGHVPLL
jgi:hypothetical protein